MDIILYTDGLYTLVPVTKQMVSDIALFTNVDCFDLCDILRIKLTTYHDAPVNRHVMNDGSGDFFGCICK
jgi:5-methylthioribose kinase